MAPFTFISFVSHPFRYRIYPPPYHHATLVSHFSILSLPLFDMPRRITVAFLSNLSAPAGLPIYFRPGSLLITPMALVPLSEMSVSWFWMTLHFISSLSPTSNLISQHLPLSPPSSSPLLSLSVILSLLFPSHPFSFTILQHHTRTSSSPLSCGWDTDLGSVLPHRCDDDHQCIHLQQSLNGQLPIGSWFLPSQLESCPTPCAFASVSAPCSVA